MKELHRVYNTVFFHNSLGWTFHRVFFQYFSSALAWNSNHFAWMWHITYDSILKLSLLQCILIYLLFAVKLLNHPHIFCINICTSYNLFFSRVWFFAFPINKSCSSWFHLDILSYYNTQTFSLRINLDLNKGSHFFPMNFMYFSCLIIICSRTNIFILLIAAHCV